MRIHHLNCGSLRKVPPLVGEGPPEATADRRATVCHCLLIETDADGLVLVDTGLGTADLNDPEGALGADWVAYAERTGPGGKRAAADRPPRLRAGGPTPHRAHPSTPRPRRRAAGLSARAGPCAPRRVPGRHGSRAPAPPAQPRPLHAGAPGARPVADARRPGRGHGVVRLPGAGTSARARLRTAAGAPAGPLRGARGRRRPRRCRTVASARGRRVHVPRRDRADPAVVPPRLRPDPARRADRCRGPRRHARPVCAPSTATTGTG